MQWVSSFGGLCAAQPRTCDFRESTPQDNWFFTQYISYINATEVFVNITANFQECRLNPSCTQYYVDMYHYERNGVDAILQQETLPTISLYDVLSNQVILVDNSIRHPFPLLLVTLMESTLGSETLVPVLTFCAFRSTIVLCLKCLMVRLSRNHG